MKKNWLVLILAVVFIPFMACCAKKQVVKQPAVSEQPAVEQAKPEETVTAPSENKTAETVGGLEKEKISEEELARQQRIKQEEEMRQEIAEFENEEIYFDFDKYNIRPDAAEILERKAAWLKQHPNVHVLIEGHCDEWGSEEYNLALGERRANSAKEFLVNLGIDPERISTISYGEERPAVVPPAYCEEVRQFMLKRHLRPDHASVPITGRRISTEQINTCETAWAKNRRCHFVVEEY